MTVWSATSHVHVDECGMADSWDYNLYIYIAVPDSLDDIL
jgi:hypothetical protein